MSYSNSDQADQQEASLARWINHPIWWQDISARNCVLTRRNPKDAQFLRLLWSNKDFISEFHPLAPPLPESDEVLDRILQKEFLSPSDKSRNIHWVVRSADLRPWGLLSLCDMSLQHRRAEIMIGVLPDKPFGLPIAAMLMIYVFFFKSIKFNKLCSLVFSGNHNSLQTTMNLGFKQEGFLLKHVIDKRSGTYCDIHQMGLLEADAFSEKNLKLMKKILNNHKEYHGNI